MPELNTGHTINSLDEANTAVFDHDKALRYQPPAPQPTEYYYMNESGWTKHVAGHRHASKVTAEDIRGTIKRGIGRETVMVVSKEKATPEGDS